MALPADFWGTVTIDGESGVAVNGAIVDAYINNEKVATAIVGDLAPGYYLIHVPDIYPVPNYPEGTLVFFKINNVDINEGSHLWVGGSDNNLNISIGVIIAEIIDMTIHNNTTDMMYQYAPGGPFGDWVPIEPEATEGDSISIWVRIINNGSLIYPIYGEFISTDITPIPPGEELIHAETLDQGVAKWFFPWSFIMPSNSVYITIGVGHSEGGGVNP